MPRSTETLSLRVPREELDELRRRARDAGCSLNAYLRDRLSREHEDTSAAVALAAQLSENRFDLLEKNLEAWKLESSAAATQVQEKLDKLGADQASKLTTIGQALQRIVQLIQGGK
jgi:hypothetical protein